MKIRMTAHVSGLRNGSLWPTRGDELVVDDAEGAELCSAGLAEPVAVAHKPETRPAPAGVEAPAPEAPETRPARRSAVKRG